MTKTASGLVESCKMQLGHPYWMGTYGQVSTKALYLANKARLPQYYTANDFLSQLGVRVFDCVGLIKYYRWSATPTSAPVYVASQDVPVSGLLKQCSRRGSITKMPDQPGTCVFMSGHVGVYVGDGYVIEARGHAYGVVKTALRSRPWTQWGQPDWITYDTETGGNETVNISLKVVYMGSTGQEVRSLQILLNGKGYACGEADGEFGSKTRSAVLAYQKDNGLVQDAVVGSATWTKLLCG